MTNWLPKKNDKFKAKLKDHEDYYFACGHALICVKWTQIYIPKGRKKKDLPRFCEAMLVSKLALPKNRQTADFKLDRAVWQFEAVMEGPGIAQEPRTPAGPILTTHKQ